MKRQSLMLDENTVAIEVVEQDVQSITIQRFNKENGDRILLYWDVKGKDEHHEFTTMNMLKKLGDK